jgi:hypothetical protein
VLVTAISKKPSHDAIQARAAWPGSTALAKL